MLPQDTIYTKALMHPIHVHSSSCSEGMGGAEVIEECEPVLYLKLSVTQVMGCLKGIPKRS